MEGSGGRGGHGGASSGRGKGKKARARAKTAASSTAPVASASTALAKKSGGKKVAAAAAAAVDAQAVALAPASSKTKAVKTTKTGKAAAVATTSATATRLVRKKPAGVKGVVTLKKTEAATSTAAPVAPKKRAAAKKQQRAPAAPASLATHEHDETNGAERVASEAHEATAKSTIVSLTGGKRARGKKRRAGSIGSSDHESSGPSEAAEGPFLPPALVQKQDTPGHLLRVTDHGSHAEAPTRIAFLGGPAGRESASQEMTAKPVTGTAKPRVETVAIDSQTAKSSPTVRVAGAKKAKAAKKSSVRAKAVGGAPGAMKKGKPVTTPNPAPDVEMEASIALTKQASRGMAPEVAPASDAMDESAVGGSALKTTRRDKPPCSLSRDDCTVETNVTAAVQVPSAGDTKVSATKAVVVVKGNDKPPPSTSNQLDVPPPTPAIRCESEQHAASAPTQPLSRKPKGIPASIQPDRALALLADQPVDAANPPADPPSTLQIRTPLDAKEPTETASDGAVRADCSSVEETSSTEAATKPSSAEPPVAMSDGRSDPNKEIKEVKASGEPTPDRREHEAGRASLQHSKQHKNSAAASPRGDEPSNPTAAHPPSDAELHQCDTSAPVGPSSPALARAATPPLSVPHVSIPDPRSVDRGSDASKDRSDGVTSPATLAVRRIFSGEMKRLQAAHSRRLPSVPENPSRENPRLQTSKKRRREDSDGDGQPFERQKSSAPLHDSAPPSAKQATTLGIVMDSHEYVARMMRSDPVCGPVVAAEPPACSPAARPSNAWGASFGLSVGRSNSSSSRECDHPTPGSPLSSTRPLSSWFLSKGAADFVKRVSFAGDARGVGGSRTAKRRRISVGVGVGDTDREREKSAFLSSLASHAAWRSWFAPEGQTPASSLLDPLPSEGLPRALLESTEARPLASSDGNAALDAAPGGPAALARLEEGIREEKRRAREFERLLLLVLQGRTASGRAFEDEYGAMLAMSPGAGERSQARRLA